MKLIEVKNPWHSTYWRTGPPETGSHFEQEATKVAALRFGVAFLRRWSSNILPFVCTLYLGISSYLLFEKWWPFWYPMPRICVVFLDQFQLCSCEVFERLVVNYRPLATSTKSHLFKNFVVKSRLEWKALLLPSLCEVSDGRPLRWKISRCATHSASGAYRPSENSSLKVRL